jgi:hypothetical protein
MDLMGLAGQVAIQSEIFDRRSGGTVTAVAFATVVATTGCSITAAAGLTAVAIDWLSV